MNPVPPALSTLTALHLAQPIHPLEVRSGRMELTFVNDLGQTFVIDIDPGMELENVMALLEAEARFSSSFIRLSWPG